MPTLDWRPAWNADYGFATAPTEGPVKDWVRVANGHFYVGAKRFVVFGTASNEAVCAMDDASERMGVPKRVAAHGFNVIRFLGLDSKATPSGIWNNTAFNATTTYDETYMSRMDEMIANYNARGIYVYLGVSNHFGRMRRIALKPPNIQSLSSAYEDCGMQWSDEWIECFKPYVVNLLERTNTITGVKYKNNPGIMCWEFFNENGMADVMLRSAGWFDDIVNNVGGAGYWLTELNAKLAAWVALDTSNRTMPSATWPLYATWSGWSDADRAKLVDFARYCEVNRATELKAWLKGYNSNLLFCYGETNYSDSQVAAVSDVAGFHAYAREVSGDANSPVSSPYVMRSSVLKNSNGWEWAVPTAMRHPSVPFILNEFGNYGLTPWDFETPPLQAVVNCLQDADGICNFVEGQDLFQSSVVGIGALSHQMAGWPSRKLSLLAAAPIFKHRFIAPLTGSTSYVLDPAGISLQVVANPVTAQRVAAQTGFRYNTTSDGSEWSFLAKQLSTSFGTPEMATSDKTIKDANITAGITITVANGSILWRGIAAANPVVRLNFPAVQGFIGTVVDADGPAGTMAITGAGGYKGLCLIRSNGDYPLYTGDALLFVHQHSYPTGVSTSVPGGAWDGSTEGVTINSAGTEANTRIVVPAAFTITLTSGRDLNVMGVTSAGALVDMVPTWNSGAGTVSFATSTSYPVYHISPKVTARKRSVARR